MKKIYLATGLAIALAACDSAGTSGVAPSQPAPPKVEVQTDLSTSDKAIKSYWATLDSVRRAQREFWVAESTNLEALRSPLKALFTAEARAEEDPLQRELETFSRDIISIDVETESRAVVVTQIRNTTPIPAGAEVSEYVEEARRKGDKYKYVLEQGDGEWKVAEIWEERTFPDTHWEKVVPEDSRPRAASFTFEGR